MYRLNFCSTANYVIFSGVSQCLTSFLGEFEEFVQQISGICCLRLVLVLWNYLYVQ